MFLFDFVEKQPPGVDGWFFTAPKNEHGATGQPA